MNREVMSRELERLLTSVCEVVLEQEDLAAALEDQQYRPAEESARLKLILSRSIEDFRRFYLRRSLDMERTLTAQQVADRYGLTLQWVHHCKELKKIGFKVGKYLHFKEKDLAAFEAARAASQKEAHRGFTLQPVMRHDTLSNTTDGKLTRFIVK